MKKLAVIHSIFIVIFSLSLIFAAQWPVQGGSKIRGKIRFGYLQSDLHQLPCWVAIEKGFYKNQGLDVEIAGIFKAGPEEMSAFSGGSLDIGYVGEAPATTARSARRRPFAAAHSSRAA